MHLSQNGVVVLIFAQVALFVATIFSLTALADCHFVTVKASSVDPFLTTIFENENVTRVADENTRRGLGFLFYEDTNGECNWDRNHTEATFEDYIDFLGDDWEDPRGIAVAAAILGGCAWFWLLVFSCLAHVRVVRYILAALIAVPITVLQASTYTILDSDFCSEHDCEMGRSARIGAVAVSLFFITGVLMFFTRNYPGDRHQDPVVAPFPAAKMVETTQTQQQTNEERTMDEEDPNRHHVGFAEEHEIPVDTAFVNVSLTENKPETKVVVY